ncbi:MAG: phospholipase D-like domain-containing protein, partial [Steroidobacteraceae bacterium]
MTASRKRRWRFVILLPAACIWIATAVWHTHKPLPEGTHVTGDMIPVADDSLQWLADITASNHYGELISQQAIHAATLDLVLHAQQFLVLDYFLFNGQGGPAGPLRYERGMHPVALELTEALRSLRQREPSIPILVIVDPINDYYRGTAPDFLAALEQIGVEVVVTRLDALRDSNPVYSTTWRLLAGWWLSPGINGRWSNPLDAAGPDLTLGALLRIPQFKANHRKVAITGDGHGSLRGMVSSANPHDASSAHSNVALRFEGEALRPLLQSEVAIATLSGWRGTTLQPFVTTGVAQAAASPGSSRVGIATEGAILEQLLLRFGATGNGDAIDIAMFYLADRPVIEALLAAAARGVSIRVLLDPNKDAFGFEKSGIPNRQVASELIAASDGAIRLRWYRTHGEQFHAKLTVVRSGERVWLTLGSANLTRRNLNDYNLEANVIVDTPATSVLAGDVMNWFEMLWTNRPGGTEYS